MKMRGFALRFTLLLLPFFWSFTHCNQLQVGYYNSRCPRAELIVRTVVSKAISYNRGVAAGLLRMHFHDCFVQGCDGSVLLDSTFKNQAEKDAIPNRSLRGFEVIDQAKDQLEAYCPRAVSCADILAFAARDSVSLLGGPFWQVPAGRRDGTISNAAQALASLPAPFLSVQQLTQIFAAKGLSQDDMTALSGAHTIGVAHCLSFKYRLYNFSNLSDFDPTLNQHFVQKLKALCPVHTNPSSDPEVSLDSSTPNKFDNTYYLNLEKGHGLLQSDQALFLDAQTSKSIKSNAEIGLSWFSKFIDGMVKMSMIEVKTGNAGEIRKNCHFVNEI